MVKGCDLGFALGMTRTGVTWFPHKSLRLRLKECVDSETNGVELLK